MGDFPGHGQLKTVLLIVMLIAAAHSIGIYLETDGSRETRLSELIKFDLLNTRTSSSGIDGWGEFVVGRVNHTTSITTRLMNNGDVPLSDIEVTCTIYWYDGFYPDRGEEMFKDIQLVDLPGGDGSYSETVEYLWVPSFSGAYMINLSAHVPGDARPMSTEPPFFQGLRYEPIPGSYFYSGVWVASEYWDGSSMDGWSTYSNGTSIDERWDSVIHPMSDDGSKSHSAPECFWSGNRTTWNSSNEGSQDLISPPLELGRFDPEPYDVERSIRRPQIYFLYRYKGDFSGYLIHYVSTDDGETWDILTDLKDEPVVVTGNTTMISWDYSKRPFYVGNGQMVGLDLGKYVGSTIRLRFDQVSSGINESGYMLDDITLMGMDLVEPIPFELGPLEVEDGTVDPGSSVRASFNITSKKSLDSITVRFQSINSSGTISSDEDVKITPEIVELSGGGDPETIKVRIDIPHNERAGDAWVLVRALGSGISEDVMIDFSIRSKHGHSSKLQDPATGGLETGIERQLSLSFENTGNTVEKAHIRFIPIDDIHWNVDIWKDLIEPGETVDFQGTIAVDDGSAAGVKKGLIITSIKSLPDDAIILDKYLSSNLDPDWQVHELNFTLEQIYDIDLMVSSSYKELKDPPNNGTVTTTFDLFLLNNGNGMDQVELVSNSTEYKGTLKVIMPDEIYIGPGESRSIEVGIETTFPMTRGRYDFRIEAISSGDESPIDNIADLTLIIGSQPISSGTFLVNGSVSFSPNNIIMGTETIISFKAQTFGIPEEPEFITGLSIDGKVVTSSSFPFNVDRDTDYQIVWTFDSPGEHNISLEIFTEHRMEYPEIGLLKRVEASLKVRYIDLSVDYLFIDGKQLTDAEIEPGKHQVSAIIENNGDIEANIATITMEVIEVGRPENITIQSFNITEILPGTNQKVHFNKVKFLSERTYRITVYLGNKGKWKENNTENDEYSTTVDTGVDPLDQPLWRNNYLIAITFMVVLVISVLLFLYLMRKKL